MTRSWALLAGGLWALLFTAGCKGECGDAALRARYGTCVATVTAGSCEAAGGMWLVVGLAGVSQCECPTGQGECSCETRDECLAGCIGGRDAKMPCVGTELRCNATSNRLGCYCTADEEGLRAEICVD
ncbi:MAG: hypothetical protein HY901_11365 [Deltaproteobacteria bacterium]|nr:hypothetical protein [Deltaproteobacteria bacterium]